MKQASRSLVHDRKGNGRVELYVHVAGTKRYIATPVVVDKDKWFDGVVVRHKLSDKYNLLLRKLVMKFDEYVLNVQMDRGNFLPQDLLNYDRDEGQGDFLAWWEKMVYADREVAPGTTAHRLVALAKFRDLNSSMNLTKRFRVF